MNIEHAPTNIRAEQHFLGCLLSNPSLTANYINVPRAVFSIGTNSTIWEHIIDLYRRGMNADFATISVLLNNNIPDHVYDMTSRVYAASDIDDFYNALLVAFYKRSIYTQLYRLEASIQDDKSTIQDISWIVGDMYKQQNMTNKETTVTIFTEVTNIIQNWDTRPNPKIPTGYTKLDTLFNGWLSPGQLVVVWGRPWMGKTSFMLNIASNQSDAWYKVGFVSFEMLNSDLAQKYMSIKSKVPYSLIDKREDSALDKLVHIDTNDNDLVLIPSTKDLNTMITRIVAQKIQHWLDVVYIDYLQLMVPYNKSYNRDQAIGITTGALKALALEHEIVIVIWSQLNRDAEKWWIAGRPSLNHLRESGNVEQDIDIAMLLYRDKYYDREDGEEGIEVDVAKHRNGPIGVAKLGFDGPTMSIYNIKQAIRWTTNA